MSSVKNDPAKALGNLWNSVVKEGARAAEEARKLVAESIDDIGKATTSGGAVGGALQAFEELSPGNFAAGLFDVLTGPDQLDPKLAAGIRGGVNLSVGALVPGPGMLLQAQALKDAASALGMLGGSPTSPPAGQAPVPPQQQSTESPSEAGRRTGGSPTSRAEWSTEKRARIDEARAEARVKIETKAREANQNGRIADLEGRVAHLEKLMGVQENKPGGGYGGNTDMSSGFVTIDFGAAKPGKNGDPRLAKLEQDLAKADADIDKILSNPNLSFEDMVFLLMSAVIKQSQAEVKIGLADEKAARDVAKGGRDVERNAIKAEGSSIAKEQTRISGMEAGPDKDRASAALNERKTKLDSRSESLTTSLGDASESRTERFEELKNAMNKLSEMQQSLSNILNTMHQSAMNTIGNIR
jgi:hypothetical protein